MKVEVLHRLKCLNLSPSRRLGQNFLYSTRALKFVKTWAKKLADKHADYRIFSIGPGIAIFEEELAKAGFRVLSIEKDAKFFPLYAQIKSYNPNFHTAIADARFVKFPPFPIFSNLPYYASKFFIDKICLSNNWKFGILCLQYEVGQRLINPSGKRLSPLSAIFTLKANVVDFLVIPKHFFIPKPKVDSIMIVFEEIPDSPNSEILRKFADWLGILLQNRRKKIKNSLLFKKEHPIWEIYADYRAEELSVSTLFEVFLKTTSLNQ